MNRRIAVEILFLGLSIAAASAVLDAFPPGEPRAALHHDISIALLSAAVTFARTLLGYLAIVAGGALFATTSILHTRATFWAISIGFAAVRLVEIRDPHLVLSSFLRASATGFVVLVLMSLVYLLMSRVSVNERVGAYLDRILFIVPLLLAEVWVACWLLRYENDGLLVSSGLLFAAGYAGIVLISTLPLLVWRRGPWPWKALGIAVLLVALIPALPMAEAGSSIQMAAAATPDRPPVILIVIDTLRADALSVYNEGGVAAKSIEALARDSVVFRHASAPSSWTVPSVLSMMSGLSPYVHRAGFGPKPFTGVYYPGPLPTLAQLLRDQGYSTKALVGNTTVEVAQNAWDGFDDHVLYHENPAGRSRGAEWLLRVDPLRFATGGNTEALTREALEWIETNQRSKFFLWLHYFDPHWTYAPPPQYRPVSDEVLRRWTLDIEQEEAYSGRKFSDEEQNEARSLYRGEVKFVDDNVGAVVSRLKDLGIYDDALIILTSDHGEEFWDHGHFGHGHSMHTETVRVPFMVKLPNNAVTGEIEEHVSTQALTPTVLDLLRIESQRHPAWPLSLAPYLSENPPAEPIGAPVFSAGSYRFEEMEMVILNDVKVVHKIQSDEWLAFDLKTDPLELVDRADDDLSEVVDQARQLLKDYRTHADEVRGGVENEQSKDPALIERLRSLGYAR